MELLSCTNARSARSRPSDARTVTSRGYRAASPRRAPASSPTWCRCGERPPARRPGARPRPPRASAPIGPCASRPHLPKLTTGRSRAFGPSWRPGRGGCDPAARGRVDAETDRSTIGGRDRGAPGRAERPDRGRCDPAGQSSWTPPTAARSRAVAPACHAGWRRAHGRPGRGRRARARSVAPAPAGRSVGLTPAIGTRGRPRVRLQRRKMIRRHPSDLVDPLTSQWSPTPTRRDLPRLIGGHGFGHALAFISSWEHGWLT